MYVFFYSFFGGLTRMSDLLYTFQFLSFTTSILSSKCIYFNSVHSFQIILTTLNGPNSSLSTLGSIFLLLRSEPHNIFMILSLLTWAITTWKLGNSSQFTWSRVPPYWTIIVFQTIKKLKWQDLCCPKGSSGP